MDTSIQGVGWRMERRRIVVRASLDWEINKIREIIINEENKYDHFIDVSRMLKVIIFKGETTLIE